MKSFLKTVLITLAFACQAQAAVISTDFSGTLSGTDVPYTDAINVGNNGDQPVATTGYTWNVTNASQLALKELDNLSFGNYAWGDSTTKLSTGLVFSTLAGGQYNTGTTGDGTKSTQSRSSTSGNANLFFSTNSVGATATAAPANLAVWNLLFELKDPSLDQFNVSFRAGTSNSSGVWRNNTAANNGDVNVYIIPVNLAGSNGTLNTAGQVSFAGSPKEIGAGAGPTVSMGLTHTFTSGTYLLQIQHFDKESQRAGIDDLTFTAITTIPEPTSWAILAGTLTTLVVFRRRRQV